MKAIAALTAASCAASTTPTTPATTNVVVAPRASISLAELCEPPCVGYSPATDSWVCQRHESGSGMVAFRGELCAFQLLRDTHVVADVVVRATTLEMRNDEVVTIDVNRRTTSVATAFLLAPPDLVPVTTIDLAPGRETPIAGSRHRMRYVPGVDSGRSSVPSLIQVLCDGPRRRPIAVHRGQTSCELVEQYMVAIAPGGKNVALIDHSKWGCVDYGLEHQNAHPIDLDEVCADDPR